MSEYDYYPNSYNSNSNNTYDVNEKLKKGLPKLPESNLVNANIISLVEKAEGQSPTLLDPVEYSKIIYTKPICDTLGFTQHFEECANDAFQQVLLSADNLKHITQAKMFDDTIPDKIDKPLLKKYVKYMQKRFQLHYGLITGQTPYKAKRRMSFIASHVCHDFFIGGRIYTRISEYNAIKNALGLNKYSLEKDGKINTTGYIISTNNYHMQTDGYLHLDETTGHILGLFICASRYYLYDNEAGIQEINSEIYKHPEEWVIIRDKLMEKNYIVKLKSVKKNRKYKKIKDIEIDSVWEKGEWKETNDELEEVMREGKRYFMMDQGRIGMGETERIIIRRRKAKTIKRRRGARGGTRVARKEQR
jgi:hypothetical protein